MLVSGTPEDGPGNIFYGDSLCPNENHTLTFEKPCTYPYYNPAWTHIRGVITVENSEISSNLGSGVDSSYPIGVDDSLLSDSNASDVTGFNSNEFNTSDSGLTAFPSSSSSSSSSQPSFPSSPSFPSFTTDNNTSDQSSILSSLATDQTLGNILKKSWTASWSLNEWW